MNDALPEVLIVDDLELNVNVLTTLLRRNGFTPRGAQSGREAIEAIHHKLPDAILLDVMMPEMDGFETARRIKAIPWAADVPIIFVTAKDTTEDKVRGFEIGGVDYITKPYEVREVLARVSTHVTMYQQKREITMMQHRDRQLVAMLEDDIAHRKIIESKLRESEARFTQLADSINEVFFLLDLETEKFLYISSAFERIFQHPLMPLLADSSALKDVVHPDDRDNIALSKLGQAPYGDIEFRIVRPDREVRWVRMTFSPVLDEHDEPYRIAGIMDDVTFRKQAEQHRLEAELQKEKMRILYEFMSTTSHEFRTPLAVIQMKSDLLDRVSDSETVSRHLDGIREQTRIILRLVESLSLMARLDSEEHIAHEPMTINEVVYKLIDAHRHEFQDKSLELYTDFDKSLPIVEGDDRILYKAFDSLLENAIRYTPEGGKIGVRTYNRNNHVYIEFSDTGIGIEDEIKPLIFERFYRAESSRTTRGFGLGLPIAQKVVEVHEGKIEFDTEVGKGSTFTVILPLSPAVVENESPAT